MPADKHNEWINKFAKEANHEKEQFVGRVLKQECKEQQEQQEPGSQLDGSENGQAQNQAAGAGDSHQQAM